MMKRKRILSSLLSFIFLFSFLAVTPLSKVSAATNLAAGKLPTASSTAFKNLSYITDGIISTSNYSDSSTATGLQWVQIDLGASYNINEIKLWHYYGVTRTYNDVIVQVSNNKDFTAGTYTTVFNNDTNNSAGFGTGTDSEYVESSAGKDITFSTAKAQYVRFYTNGNKANPYNHYTEIQIFEAQAPVTGNLAATILPTASSSAFKNLAMATDSIKSASNYADSATATGLQWVQINLGAAYNLNDIKLWHYFGDTRKYHDVIVMVSNNANFTSGSYTIVYNNDTNNSAGFGTGTKSEYSETSSGLDIPFTANNAQYVRFYSNGSTVNNYNHYGEIEIYAAANVVDPTDVTLNKTTDSINVGATDTLTATVVPSDATNKTVTWSSNNTAVATVSSSGVVTGVSAGTATITAKTSNNITATCDVTVNAVAVTSITLNKATDTINVGGNDTLTAAILPSNATDKTVTWSSDNTAVATVSSSGTVTGISIGTATITATTSNNMTDTCAVTVSQSVILPTSISLNKATDTLLPGATDTLTATILPANATDKSVTWTSSNTSAVTVNSSGVVTAVNAGTSTITAKTSNNLTATCAVTVKTVDSTTNLALGIVPTSPSSGWKNLSYVTDGIKSSSNYADSGTGTGLQYIQLDLGKAFDLSYIKLWHLVGYDRQYHDVIVKISNDPNFTTGVTTVYNNDTNNSAGMGTGTNSEYIETTAGLSIPFSTVSARYVRFYSNGSSVNNYNHYAEIELYSQTPTTPASGNIAAGKPVSASSSAWVNLSEVTNTKISESNYADSGSAGGLQWVQIDLGASTSISYIKLWHFFTDPRMYHDVIVQVSNDQNFGSGVTTVYNNDTNNSAGKGTGTKSEYAESSAGLNIAFTPVTARYVRCYSNGSNINNYNHVTEVEVFSTAPSTVGSGNLAAGKAVTASTTFANLAYVNDSVKAKESYADTSPTAGLQWVQIDLGAAYDLSYIKLWHYFADSRKYHDVIVQISNDPTFATGAITVYNNDTDNSAGKGKGGSSEYTETGLGLELAFAPTNARYVRCYSNGSSVNGFNHYVEVEVYSEVPASQPLANANWALDIPTYDGSGQTVHPSVVYFPNGWHGYKYWMAHTPYPYSNDASENPSICASNDGVNWVDPPGIDNPLDGDPAVGHNCDPELIYNAKTDQLYLYWIYTNDIDTNWTKLVKSSNGSTWTSPQIVITDTRDCYSTLSPTIDYNSSTGVYTMWEVNAAPADVAGQNYFVERRTSTDGISWSSTTKVAGFGQSGCEIWHIFIRYIPSQNEYWALAAAMPDPDTPGTAMTQLYFLKSADGLTWKQYPSKQVLPTGYVSTWDSARIYRSCFVYDPSTDAFKVWYSATNADSGYWGVGYTANTSTNMMYNLLY